MSLSRKVCDALFDYQTLKIVNIGDKKIGLLHRIIQLLILGYILGFVIIFKRGYQQFSTYNSVTTAKVKGVVSTLDYRDEDFVKSVAYPAAYRRIWDVSDLVVPPSEPDAFFVTTNLIITEQVTARCPEELMKDSTCESDSDCEDGRTLLLGHGSQTGSCVAADHPTAHQGVCEIRGWCPVEYDEGPLKGNQALLSGVQNFTVLLKNYIEFPTFRLKLRNIADSQNRSYLQTCVYNPDTHPHCPKFRLGDIINATGHTFNSIAAKGGVVHIVITWNCNFDRHIRYCVPRYDFSRIDDSRAQLGRGWNFRHSHYHNATQRTLFKAYGITFRVAVSARGGKLNLLPLAINIGSGLGLLAVAKVVCDFVVLYCHSNRELYKQHKVRFVEKGGRKRRATISITV
ncbi:P2X purinoceptor 4 [Galendromus occidentalis]|uniref:P2X purinoceptor 4 n=1 Tax=Galendromus occidentalis TaxID=34638 RepID=A0AAJ6VZA5_9ACAR|nr:P2X purinoceptor 4 [Galendromus occidentalis]